MNIFILNHDPALAARDLCEKHISKMYLESAQLLQTCFPKDRLAANDCPRTVEGSARKHSYFNHPCSKWTRQTKQNMLWLLDHADAIESERLTRGYNPHSTVPFLKWARANVNNSTALEGPLTEYAIAINSEKKCRADLRFDSGDAVTKYRLYYKYDKPFAKWKNGRPEWFDVL